MPGYRLPSELLNQGREDRESDALGTIASDIDRTTRQAWSGLTSVAGGMADSIAPAVSPIMEALNGGGLKVPTLDDLTPDWAKEATQRATQTASSIASGIQIPSMDDLTPEWAKPRPATPTTTVGATGTPAAMPQASAAPAAGTPPPGAIDNSSRESFIRTAYPWALQAHNGNAAEANQQLAIAISENGDIGTGKDLSQMGFNFSGVHAQPGERSFMSTDAGRPTAFRAYDNPAQGLSGFMDFLRANPRYAPALERYRQTGDIDQLTRDANAAGYSETPGWQDNIRGIRTSQVEPLTRSLAAARPGLTTPTQAEQTPAAQAQVSDDVAQSALDDPDKWSLCGPVAAVIAANRRGGHWTVAEAKRIAQQGNLWDANLGMHGLEAQATMLRNMGFAARTGAADQATLAREAATGNTPIISTNRHYFILTGYNPQDGTFDTTTTGGVLKGGGRHLTLDQIASLGNGIQGAAYFDNPTSRTASVAADPQAMARIPLNAPAGAPPAPGQPPSSGTPDAGQPPASGVSALDDARATNGGGAGLAMKAPLDPNPEAIDPSMGPGDGGTAPQAYEQPYDPDMGPREATPGSIGAQPLPQPIQATGSADVAPTSQPLYGPSVDEAGPATVPGQIIPSYAPQAQQTAPFNPQPFVSPDAARVLGAVDETARGFIDSQREQVERFSVLSEKRWNARFSGGPPLTDEEKLELGQIETDMAAGTIQGGGRVFSNAADQATNIIHEAGAGARRLIGTGGQGATRGGVDAAIEMIPPDAGPGIASRIGEAARGVGTRIGEGIEAGRQTARELNAQPSAGGAMATFGQIPEGRKPAKTVEWIQDQIATTQNWAEAASRRGDDELAAMARERIAKLQGDLVDARNARLDLEPRITSDIGRRAETLPITEQRADMLDDMRRPDAVSQADAANLSGPVGVPTDTSSRLNGVFGMIPDDPAMREAVGPTVRPQVRADAGDIEARAVKEFGSTENVGSMGYVLRDGTGLDFSGGGPGRGLDHRSINTLTGVQGTPGMRQFMGDTGAVRISTASGGELNVDIPNGLSSKQRALIAEEARYAEAVYLDVTDPKTGERISSQRFVMAQDRGKLNQTLRKIPDHVVDEATAAQAETIAKTESAEMLKSRIAFARETLAGKYGKPDETARAYYTQSLQKDSAALREIQGGAKSALGIMPRPAPTDRLGAVNRVLGQGVASTFSGGISAATADQLGDPNDPNRRAKAFVAGAVAPALLARGARAAARMAGKEAGAAEGALAAFGHVPEPGKPNRAVAMGADPSKQYEFRYRVKSLGDLIPSHLPNGQPNPAFPKELQPRARERAASQMQIDQIARGLVPDALLNDAGRLDSGPMIVGPDNIVESGNGRTLALQRAASRYPEQYQQYVDALRGQLGDYGLTEDALKGVDRPVLVRERVTDVDRPAFAAEANNAGLLRMSSFEQAVQDAGQLSDEAVTNLTVGENDTIASALRRTDNRGLVRQWVGTLPENERAGVIDANGDLSAQGYDRLTNALLVRTYGQGAGERLARTFIESADPTVRNVQAALMASLPDMARAESLISSGQRAPELSIGEDVAKAVEMLARLRREGVKVDDYLSQGAMFERELTPLQEDILGFMGENTRRPSTIRETLKDYAERVENTADPNQVDMFGDQVAPPSREDLWRGAANRTGRDARDIPPTPIEAYQEPVRVPADGAGLAPAAADAVPEPTTAPGATRAPQAPVTPQRPGRLPDEVIPPTGGPEGVLTQEGAPSRLAPPTQAERGTLPAGGPEGTLAVEGAPAPFPRPGPAESIAPATGGPEGTLAQEGAPPPFPRPSAVEPIQIPPSLNTPRLQSALTAAQRRAANIERRGLTAPSAWDWLKQAGYAGIYGPATLVNSLVGGAQELVMGQPKELVRALVSGRGRNYGAQASAQIRAMPEGLAGLGRVLFGADSAETIAARSGGSQGTANLSERIANPAGHFAARLLERPGEILTEAPDAVFRPAFMAQGMQREAGTIAAELGLRGSKAQEYAAELMRMADELRANPDAPVASSAARRIVDAGAKYADELGYKGKPGGFGQWLGSVAKRDDAIGVLASFLVPFPSMAARMSTAAARSTPGIGLLPSVRRGQATAFDVIYDQAFGTAVAGGLAYWAFNGGITGSGPTDKEKRQMMIDEGWQPNSTLIAGHYIPNRVFGRFQPMLDTAGEIHDALAYGKQDQKPSDMAADLVKRGTRIATDQTGLSGLADLYDMLNNGFASQFPGWATRSAARYVPYAGVIRAAATSLDPTQRKPERWADVGLGESMRQQAQLAIPGQRQNVPATQTTLGQPAANPQQGFGAIVPRVTTPKDDPILSVFQSAGVDIGAPRSDVMDEGVKIDLSPAETRRWNELRGQEIARDTQRMIDNGVLDRLPAARRTERLTDLKTGAGEAATRAIKREIGTAEWSRRRREARAKGAA